MFRLARARYGLELGGPCSGPELSAIPPPLAADGRAPLLLRQQRPLPAASGWCGVFTAAAGPCGWWRLTDRTPAAKR